MNGAAVNEPEPAGNAGAARGGTNPRLFFTTLYGLTLDGADTQAPPAE